MLQRGLNLHDPRYMGHQVPASLPLAGLFDAVGSVTNQVMAVYEMGPWATAVEQALVRELGAAIGWAPDTFAGLVTHGGSLANLTALLTARNVALGDVWEPGVAGDGPQPVLVTHADAHYSVARAAGILGLGSRQIRRVGLDGLGRMDPRQLDDQLASLRAQDQPIVAVSACSCATPTGAFDPLEEIAAVCRRHGVWLHVDAAHGGAALLSERHRHLLAGLDQADSVTWDAHKMLFVPACAPSSSTATGATVSRRSVKKHPISSIRLHQAWPTTTAAPRPWSAPNGPPRSGCGVRGRCSGGNSSPTWSMSPSASAAPSTRNWWRPTTSSRCTSRSATSWSSATSRPNCATPRANASAASSSNSAAASSSRGSSTSCPSRARALARSASRSSTR